MALKGQMTELRLARRYLMLLGLLLLLLLALAGFASRQARATSWPLVPSEQVRRGRLLAADGTVLAEGSVAARHYPLGQLAANVIGFTGALQTDGRYGLEGLEYTLDEHLQAGEDVLLTLDPALQAAAERHLAAAVRDHQAQNGVVIMLEAGSGRILAAASYPTFDPNDQLSYPRANLVNQAFLNLYEPGSVMKPFVIAGLLESGRLDPGEGITAEMSLQVGDKTFRDVSRHDPLLTLPEVLRYSSNVAMIHLSERFSSEELYGWLRHFGFGRGPDLAGTFTRSGQLRAPDGWVPQDHASITIGQSMSTTALELATAYSIFANDGVYVPPRLLENAPRQDGVRILSPWVTRAVRDMLVYTVEASALSESAIPGVQLAGKTGTADIFDRRSGTYLEGAYSLTFAGIFPAQAPRLTMVVYLQKPRAGSLSTYVAAPLFQAIGTEIVARWGLPPDPQPLVQRR